MSMNDPFNVEAPDNYPGLPWQRAAIRGAGSPHLQQPPIASPNDVSTPALRRQTREERMARIQDLITNFTYSLGAGLQASAEARGGPRNRTNAGIGASLQAPAILELAKQRLAATQALEQQRQAQADAIAGRAQNQELVPLIGPDGQPVPGVMVTKEKQAQMYSGLTGQQNQANIAAGRNQTQENIAANRNQTQTDIAQANRDSRTQENFLARQNQQAIEGIRQTGREALQKNAQTFTASEDDKKLAAAQKRTETAAANRSGAVNAPVSYADLDEKGKARIDAVKEKVKSGEYTVSQGLSAVGGVRGGLGSALTESLQNDLVLPEKVRSANTDIERAKNLMGPIHQLVDDINNTSDPEEKIKKSAQLEQYVQAIGTQFARARGERGVVTDRDVTRVLGLIPGWKSANFAPGYAKENLKLIESAFDRDQQALLGKYFTTFSKSGSSQTQQSTPSNKPKYVFDPKTGLPKLQ